MQYDFITGDKYLDLLAHDYFREEDYSAQKSHLNDSIVRSNVDPSRVMKTYFKDDPRVEEVIPNPWTFMRYLFLYAAICQDLEYELGGLDIRHYLTEEELMGLAVTYNERETKIPAVEAWQGPYYRWEDLRAHLVRISEDKSDPV